LIKYAKQSFGGRVKALFGGSFNPVHIGHLIVARDILEDFQFKKVIFVPAFIQPLKENLLIPPEIRLKLLKVSIKGEKHFDVWDYEIKQEGVSYTYKTLETYVKNYKEKPVLIMGTDSFLSFHRWKEPEKILTLSTLLIVKRPGYEENFTDVLKKLNANLSVIEVEKGKIDKTVLSHAKIIFYKGRQLQISATEIRERLKQGKSIKYMVTEEAEKILRRWWENAFQKNV
jgi:nicotinate-nucleotide adenylyltransferase